MLKIETPDPIDIEVGARVRIRRRWLGLSQTELAKALGITFQQVQKYERGSNRISASMLVKIGARLDVTVGALVGEDGGDKLQTIIYTQLSAPGALEMLDAFARIQDGESRRAVLTLASALGEREAAEVT